MRKFAPLFLSIVFIIISIYILSLQYYSEDSRENLDLKSHFKTFLYEFDDFDDELPVISIPNNLPSKDTVSISKDEALHDIEYLFSLMKFGYSGYEYFGSDTKFNLAKDNITNLILDSQDSNIPIKDFLDIIYYELSFIEDSHFYIGSYNMCRYTKYFSSREFEFFKDINGFYVDIDDDTFYLKKVNNGNPENYMKLSLDEEGKEVYNLGILSTTTDIHIPVNLLLESNYSSKNVKVSLFEYKSVYEEKIDSYNYYEVDNIPILDVKSLARVHPNDNTLDKFIQDSKKLRDTENLIIDLRGNTGGNLTYIKRWFKGFTGINLKEDIIESGLYTNTSVDLSERKFQLKNNEPESVKTSCLNEISTYKDKKHFPGWSPIKYEEFQPVDTKSNIIVLLDKSTSSAAEFFIHYLKNLNNVTLVGTNSRGCILTGNPNQAYLPNSSISLHIPHKLYMRDNFTDIEGMGFYPDIWVKPDQSLDRVIKYIKNNKGT